MTKQRTITLLIVLLGILSIAAIGVTVYLRQQRSHQTAQVASLPDEISLPAQTSLGFEASSLSVPAVGQSNIRVFLLPTTETYTAATVHLLFDPSVIDVISVEPGSFWSTYNEFENIIDKTSGEIIFSAGRGFDGTATGDSTFMTVTIVPKTSGTTQLIFDNRTLVAGTDDVGALRLKTNSLTVHIQ